MFSDAQRSCFAFRPLLVIVYVRVVGVRARLFLLEP